MIWTLLLGFLGKAWPFILAGAAALGWGWTRERAGAAKERAKREAADRTVEDIADKVDNDIGALTPEQRRERLRQWARR